MQIYYLTYSSQKQDHTKPLQIPSWTFITNELFLKEGFTPLIKKKINNYSPQWQWIVVDICHFHKHWGEWLFYNITHRN